MPKGYHHLTYEQRCQIYALKSSGMKQAAIAKQLHCSPTTISRELTRNRGKRGYRFSQADRLAQERRRQASRSARCMTPEMIGHIHDYLAEQWSPEQIAGRLRLEGKRVSHETIYQYIWRDKRAGGSLYQQLRHQGKKYNKRSGKQGGRGCIPNRIDIDKRPAVVEEKTRIGDWEGDTVIGAKHQGALATYVDRCSKFAIIRKLPNKGAAGVTTETIAAFSPISRVVETITYDNGKEFAAHQTIAKSLEAQCYFAKPYHSWERGLNEHTNGLIRQYFPKATNFHEVTAEQVAVVAEKLNNRPRKVLQYRTPKEVFFAALTEQEKLHFKLE